MYLTPHPLIFRLRAVDQAADLLSQYEQQEQMERQWASQQESEARQRELDLERARVSPRVAGDPPPG